MKVRDVMTARVISCPADTNLAAAAALMWQNDCGMLPVVGPDGTVAGVITDRDICIALGTRNRLSSDVAARDVISRPARTCGPDEDIREVLRTMCCAHVRRLPVVSPEGMPIGLLSMDDVILHAEHCAGTKRPGISYEDVVNTLRGICGHDARVRKQRVAA